MGVDGRDPFNQNSNRSSKGGPFFSKLPEILVAPYVTTMSSLVYPLIQTSLSANQSAQTCINNIQRFRIKSSISLRRQVETEKCVLLQRRMGGKYFNFTYKAYFRQNGSVEVDRKRRQSFLVMCLINHNPLRLMITTSMSGVLGSRAG